MIFVKRCLEFNNDLAYNQPMDYFKKIIIIENKRFLISSVLKLGSNYNILGFWQTSKGWSNHIHCISLPEDTFLLAIKNSSSES